MFCTKCGKEVSENKKFCPYCGAEMNKNTVSKTVKTDATQGMNQKLIIGAIVLVAAIVLVVGLVGKIKKKTGDQQIDTEYTQDSGHGYSDDSLSGGSSDGESLAYSSVEAAEGFLKEVPYSKQGLIDKMVNNGYSIAEATEAAEMVNADYEHNAIQAGATAKQLGWASNSSELFQLLIGDGYKFTDAEARAAVNYLYGN